MPLFEISTIEHLDRVYHVEAESADDARSRFEAMDYEDQEALIVCEGDWAEEEITSISPCHKNEEAVT